MTINLDKNGLRSINRARGGITKAGREAEPGWRKSRGSYTNHRRHGEHGVKLGVSHIPHWLITGSCSNIESGRGVFIGVMVGWEGCRSAGLNSVSLEIRHFSETGVLLPDFSKVFRFFPQIIP